MSEARLHSELEVLRARLARLESSVSRITSEIRHGLHDIPRALLCRDLRAHAMTAKRLAETIEAHIAAQERLLRDRIERLARQLEGVDQRLAKSLAGVLAVLLDLVKRIRALKGNAGFEGLVEEARREALEAIRERREAAEKTVEGLKSAAESVKKALRAAESTLSRYSVESPGGDPALYYILVAEFEARGASEVRDRVVFDGGIGFDPGIGVGGVDRRLYARVKKVVREAGRRRWGVLAPLFEWFLENRVEAG